MEGKWGGEGLEVGGYYKRRKIMFISLVLVVLIKFIIEEADLFLTFFGGGSLNQEVFFCFLFKLYGIQADVNLKKNIAHLAI